VGLPLGQVHRILFTAAGTDTPTGPCTWSPSVCCPTTRAPAPTPAGAGEKGLPTKDNLRCLKRFIAREGYHDLITGLLTPW